ncbi:DUF3556 domain-containing protein [Nocardioides caricicola]|uniref:DUF3556 domain-containing protein n=1 Tax=Nocardioides caricicola TaxID=634770 RepID=A0ABW0MY03_9ACTN
MGFLQPNLPDLDLEAWRTGTRAERMRPMARHVAEVGFGTPDVVFLMYVLKIGLYAGGGLLFALSTSGVDGITDIGAFQKVVLWTLLFEVLGLGCGFGPLNLRMTPPLGSFLYWLRPNTVRLPPWPGRVPLTRGTRRTPVDVLLYAALLLTTLWALLSPGPVVERERVAAMLVALALVGLRDKTIFLAARAEVYGTLSVTFLLTGADVVVAAQLVMLAIWWGAATSKLNRHFPYVVQVMMSNSPVLRSRRIKRGWHRSFPDDLRPSWRAYTLAHLGTAVEYAVPLVLFLSHGGWVTTVAAVVMIAFHLQILTSFPMGVPLEWNVFMIYGILALFVEHADYGLGDVTTWWPIALLMGVVVGTVVVGNLSPARVSFLPGMRYYAGNWDTSYWCFTEDALAKLDAGTVKSSLLPHQQLEKIYGPEQAELPQYIGYAFRSMHSHGRALFTLIPRVLSDRDEDDYRVIEGELVAGAVLGWNFGDGHFHNEQLIAALQERCGFEEGEVRVVLLEAQPIHRQTQRYRLVDAAEGELERGYVAVADMCARQPCDTDVPVTVTGDRRTRPHRAESGT